MEEEPLDTINTDSTSKYLTFVKNNKYSLFFIGAIAILLLISAAMLVIIFARPNNSNKQQASTFSPTSSPSQAVSQEVQPSTVNISPSSQATETIITPDPTQAATIENQTQPQITPGDVHFTYSNIELIGNNWARAVLTNPNVQGGAIIMEKVNNQWKIVAGPGSFFPQQYLQSLGIPQQVINSLNSSSSNTSTSPAPTNANENIQ